jgi:hypothetical protein
MTSNQIKCPHCGKDIEVSEVLTHSIRESMKAEVEGELARKEAQFAVQEKAFKAKEKELASKLSGIEEEVNEKVKAERAKMAQEKKALEAQRQEIDEEVAAKVKAEKQKLAEEALKKAKEEVAEQNSVMAAQLEAERQKNKESQKRELDLLKKQASLESREEALELELHRKMNEERKKIFEEAQKKVTQEQELKSREKDDLIKSLQSQMEHMQRKMELGSQEAAGEALEGSLKDKLSQIFPFDIFEDIKKGARGADIIQRVRNNAAKECGSILWEAKNAQTFSNQWLTKLKADQKEAGADIPVLATVTLPKDINGSGLVDDVWVTDYKTAVCLATPLRQILINVAREKAIAAHQDSMKDVLYRYITGQEFVREVKSIVTAFSKMKDDLETEKRFAMKNWKSRETQMTMVIGSVSNIYGAIEGYVGQKQLPQIDPLLLEGLAEDLPTS